MLSTTVRSWDQGRMRHGGPSLSPGRHWSSGLQLLFWAGTYSRCRTALPADHSHATRTKTQGIGPSCRHFAIDTAMLLEVFQTKFKETKRMSRKCWGLV